ncbi:MAG: hypothetical protein CM1200mP18_16300 [Gammaproteobacteria bacterium]|nr:MAG: hypothetical protein CM1200mP18_16300 [Gammaproteobacteria bacterium]
MLKILGRKIHRMSKKFYGPSANSSWNIHAKTSVVHLVATEKTDYLVMNPNGLVPTLVEGPIQSCGNPM